MNRKSSHAIIVLVMLMLLPSLACNAINAITGDSDQAPTDQPVEEPTATLSPSQTPEPADRIQLDPCSLLTEDEVAEVLGGPVSMQPAQGMGGCGYMLQSEDPSVMTQITISAAQGAEAKAFSMLSISLFASFSGDPNLMAEVEALNQDLPDRTLTDIFQQMGGIFEETGMQVTQIDEPEESGLWLLYESEFYSQGSLMLVRGEEYTSLTQIGGDMASAPAQLTSLAHLMFDRLPPAFYLLDEDGDGSFTFEYNSEDMEEETEQPEEAEPIEVVTGLVWVTAPNAGQVFAIDPQTNEVTAAIDIGRFPSDIAISGGYVWVVSTTEGTLWKINPETAEVEETIIAGGNTTHVAAGKGSVWVSGGLGLLRIDIASGARTHVVYNPCYDVTIGDNAIWVSQTQDQQLLKIDLQTNQVAETVKLEGKPSEIVYGHGTVWTILTDQNKVIGIDPATLQQTTSLSHGMFIHAIAVDPNRLWYTHPLHIDYSEPATFSSGMFSAPNPPARIAYFAGSLWATSPNDGIVTRYNPEDGSIIAEIDMDADPMGIAAGE